MMKNRDLLPVQAWSSPAPGSIGPLIVNDFYIGHKWPPYKINDVSDETIDQRGGCIRLPLAKYNANSDEFHIGSSTEAGRAIGNRYDYHEQKPDREIRVALTNFARQVAEFVNNVEIEWAEELLLTVNEAFVSHLADSQSVIGTMPRAWRNSIGRWLEAGSLTNEVGVIAEAFRILHYDAEGDNYICQSSTPISQNRSIPMHSYPLFVVPAVLISEMYSNEDEGIGLELREGIPLGFGDYIVIHTRFLGNSALTSTMREGSDQHPLRAVHAEKGLYDLVVNSTPWKDLGCKAVGFSVNRAQPDMWTGHDGTEFGYGEFTSMAIGVSRLHTVMHLASETQIPLDPEKPNWMPTHLDNRGVKRLELRTPPPSGGKSDIVRCLDCNGRVIVHIDSDYDTPSAQCPHCRAKKGIRFPQLLNPTTGAEDSLVGREVE